MPAVDSAALVPRGRGGQLVPRPPHSWSWPALLFRARRGGVWGAPCPQEQALSPPPEEGKLSVAGVQHERRPRVKKRGPQGNMGWRPVSGGGYLCVKGLGHWAQGGERASGCRRVPALSLGPREPLKAVAEGVTGEPGRGRHRKTRGWGWGLGAHARSPPGSGRMLLSSAPRAGPVRGRRTVASPQVRARARSPCPLQPPVLLWPQTCPPGSPAPQFPAGPVEAGPARVPAQGAWDESARWGARPRRSSERESKLSPKCHLSPQVPASPGQGTLEGDPSSVGGSSEGAGPVGSCQEPGIPC